MVELIKVIAFDWGGVCTNENWDVVNREIATFLKAPLKTISEIEEKHWQDLKRGNLSDNFLFQEWMKVAKKPVSLAEISEVYYGKIYKEHTNKKLIALIKKLKPKYRIIALSNASKETGDFKLEKFGFKELFDDLILSAVVGLAKPEKEIFELLIQMAGVKPSEIIFVDDNPKRLPPKEMGINGVVFKSVPQLKKDLKKLGVEVK